jgi:hypothetical protein
MTTLTETAETAPQPATAEPDMMQIALAADAEPAAAPAEPAATTAPDTADTATPGEQGKPATPAEAGKPGEQGKESEFLKAKRDQERKNRSWQALEQEKQEYRAKEAARQTEIETLRREIAELKKRNPAATPGTDRHGLAASDYDVLAKRYREQGNDEMAAAAAQKADDLRKQASSPEAPTGEPWKAPEFQQAWQQHTQTLIAQNPALADPANPLVASTNALVNHPVYGRFFKAAPDGIKAAYEVATMMQAAHAAQETRQQLDSAQAELKKTKAEVDRLTGLLQPRGSHPNGPAPGKSAGDISDDDVRAIAAAADRGELNQ